MQQGDPAWWRLAATIADEDCIAASAYNARATPDHRLALELGPLPCSGAIMTAPVVLLLSHPSLDPHSSPNDHAFRRTGWPLAALHPDAPAPLSAWWRDRLGALIDEFGAQHIANAVAAAYLTPWHSDTFDAGLRLPSRRHMLALAASAAARDAILVMMQGSYLWTEDAEVAALPVTRCLSPRSWRGTEMSLRNLGDAWQAVCKRIGVHAWV